MRRNTVTALLGLAALLGFTSSARAEELARVTVPFPFVVNEEVLPAGQYDVRTDSGDASVLIFRGHQRHPGTCARRHHGGLRPQGV